MASSTNWQRTTIGNGNDPTRDTSVDLPGSDEAPPVSADSQLVGGNGERYRIDGILGQGGGGIVWRATDRHTDRVIAIKATTAVDSDAGRRRQERLVAEARVTAKLDHPNIPPIYDLARGADGRCYFTMRLVRGRSLLELIEEAANGQVVKLIATHGDAIDLMRKVCDAVAYAHHHGIVHRDCKPANILVGDFGEVVVADWGTATTIEAAAQEHRLIGTPLYLAPEQARCEGATPASDVYALGGTLLHVLTRCSPVPTDGDAESFWERKRAGVINDEALALLPPALGDVVRQALAVDPSQRPANAEALRMLIAEWQRHRESIHLSERAAAAIAPLEKVGEYLGFRRCQDDCTHALDLWPENHAALILRQRITVAHATFALAQGDLSLAEELLAGLGNEYELLHERCRTLRTLQRNQQRRARRQRYALATAVMLALLAGAAWGWDRWRATSAWRPVLSLDLRNQTDVERLVLSSDQDVHFGKPPPRSENGVLLDSTRLLWIDNLAERGDVRLEADITFPERVDGFELLVHAERENPAIPWGAPLTYQSQVGGYQGRYSLLSVISTPGQPSIVAMRSHVLRSKQRYHVRLQMLGNRLSLWLDGELLLEHESYLPLVGAQHGALAMRCWAPVEIHAIRVERRSLPELASPLIAGDALLASGATAEAMAAYVAIADDHGDRPIATTALTRAVLATCRDERLRNDRDRLFARLEQRTKDPNLLHACQAAIALQDWTGQRYDAALTRAEQLLREDPEYRLVQDFLANRPEAISAPLAQRLLLLATKVRGLIDLQVNNLPIYDLSPLASMTDLESLDLRGTNIRDLNALAELRLTKLRIDETAVRSLAPLTGMPLQSLTFTDTQVSDIEPLRGAPLSHIDLAGTQVSNLEPIAQAPLKNLHAARSAIDRLPTLKNSPSLVDIGRTGVTSLRGLPVDRITTLLAPFCPIVDIEPLRGARNLLTLNISSTQVTDLDPLQGVPLRELDVSFCPISSLEPLRGTALRRLICYSCPISDLDPLHGAPLSSLLANGSRISDLSPLRDAPLTNVTIEGCPISNVTPLSGKALTSLNIGGCPITDFETVASFTVSQLINIHDTPLAVRAGEIATLWEQRGLGPHLALQLRATHALATNIPLRNVAVTREGRTFVVLPINLLFQEAQELATEQGGVLFTPNDAAWRNEFRNHWCPMISAWTSLALVDGTWQWHDGQTADRSRLHERLLLKTNFDDGGFFLLQDRARDVYPAEPLSRAEVVIEWSK